MARAPESFPAALGRRAAYRARARGRRPPRRGRGRGDRRAGLERGVGAGPVRRRLSAAAPWPTRPRTRAASVPAGRCSPAAAAATRRSSAPSAADGAGLVLSDWDALARRPEAAHASTRGPGRPASLRAARASSPRIGPGYLHLAWGPPEAELAERCLALAWEPRGAVEQTWRLLQKAGGEAQGDALRAMLAGASEFPRTPEVAGRAVTRPRRAGPVRVEAGFRALRPCGSYPRSRPSLSGRGPTGRASPGTRRPSDSCEAEHRAAEGRRSPWAPARRRGSGAQRHSARRRDHPRADRRPARPAGRPVRGDRGAQSGAGRADRARGDRARVRLRLREPRRPGAQVGRGLHHPPAGRRPDLRRAAARHRDALRGAAARHRRGHQRQPRARSGSASATRSPSSSTASRS